VPLLSKLLLVSEQLVFPRTRSKLLLLGVLLSWVFFIEMKLLTVLIVPLPTTVTLPVWQKSLLTRTPHHSIVAAVVLDWIRSRRKVQLGRLQPLGAGSTRYHAHRLYEHRAIFPTSWWGL
jgi:hypothetical protein